MAKNDARRNALADAGIAVLAREGSRGLTHRAIDQEAGVPTGTTTNYFRSREALLAGLFERIGTRLAPTLDDLAKRAEQPRGRALFADYMRDIVRRLTAEPDIARALFELRLDSARRPDLSAVLTPWLRTNFEADIAFNQSMGLPGGRREIALFHYAIDGLLFDLLTTPIAPDISSDDVIDDLVTGLLPDE
ncbi:TetR/AcrR family transcriptional regulator [Microbacterium sp. NPDC059771]|uniref:TetR/AcrR family transcriptional regulator n=1 Tax=Microbacterium sp. NPDC059771 TaxID=3346941 RepID=UPI00364B0042